MGGQFIQIFIVLIENYVTDYDFIGPLNWFTITTSHIRSHVNVREMLYSPE